MKNLLKILLPLLFASQTLAAPGYITIGSLPLGSAASTSTNDALPYNASTGNVTKKLTLWDIANIPTIVSTYATKASPVFTGAITAPEFIGPLTGNASTATALAANPTGCSANQYASAISATGNLTCSQPDLSNITGSLDVTRGGTGLASGTTGGLPWFSASTTMASTAAGTSGQLFRSNGTSAPSWTLATYPTATSQNEILYSSAANTVAGVATANTGVLVTSSSGVPSIQACTVANRVLRTDGSALTCSQVAAATDVSGILPVANGGTGVATLTAHGVVIANDASAFAVTAVGATGTVLHGNTGADPSYSAVSMSADVTGTLAIGNGGTGQTSKAAAFNALSPMTTGGDLIYGGASGTGTRLANGSAGQVLISNGGTAAPSWGTPGSLGVSSYSSGPQTLSAAGVFVKADLTGGAFQVNLPAASSNSGGFVYFKKTDASANALTIARAGSDTIDGATSFTVSLQYQAVLLVSDGVSEWSVF